MILQVVQILLDLAHIGAEFCCLRSKLHDQRANFTHDCFPFSAKCGQQLSKICAASGYPAASKSLIALPRISKIFSRDVFAGTFSTFRQ